MDLAWLNLNVLYYTSKLFGLFPFSGNRKYLSLVYSTVVWSLMMFSIFQMTFLIYQSSHDALGYQLWLKILLIIVCIKDIAAVLTVVISAQKSISFFALLDKFNRFDQFYLQMQWKQNRRVQIYYTFYIGFIGFYHHLVVFGTKKEHIKHMFWPITCNLSMLASLQYTIFVRMLRERYEIINILFKNCMDDTKTNTKFMYPKEIDRLFRELRCLTNEVKAHYAGNTLLFVVETAAIFVTSVTLLSCYLIYTSSRQVDFQVIVLSGFRLILFFLHIQEAHRTIESTKQTVLIAHEALSRTNNAVIFKELNTLILNCWNNPVVFDVHNLFDLDYQLIHSIFAAVFTYTVVIVQIQLALFEHATKANHTAVFNKNKNIIQ